MSSVSGAGLETVAANTSLKDPTSVAVLKKALDQNASSMAALLDSLPQRERTGTLVDVLA